MTETITQRDAKYWIKSGAQVAHRDLPGIKMIVEEVKKKKVNLKEDGKSVSKLFTIGVQVHWLNDQGEYRQGLFHTTELEPYDTPMG